MLSDAGLYSEHNDMPIHDLALFIPAVVKNMDWSDQENDVVMDIGCGTGYSTRDLLSKFPNVSKVIGFDVLPEMIEFARKHNAAKKIEYHVANIERRSTLEQWNQQMTKIVSVYCFNWLDDQEQAFRNLYNLLKPGGQAALLFALSLRVWDSYDDLRDDPKWRKYLENANGCVPESHRKKYRAPYYRQLLEDIGFIVDVCEDDDRKFTYGSDEYCKDTMMIFGFTKYIPEELRSEFKEDLFQAFLKHNERHADGRATQHYTALSLLATKPARKPMRIETFEDTYPFNH